MYPNSLPVNFKQNNHLNNSCKERQQRTIGGKNNFLSLQGKIAVV